MVPEPEPLPDFVDLMGTHFIDVVGRPHPLVVRQATGVPEFAIVDGALIRYGEYARTPQSRGGSSAPVAITASNAEVVLNLAISNPP